MNSQSTISCHIARLDPKYNPEHGNLEAVTHPPRSFERVMVQLNFPGVADDVASLGTIETFKAYDQMAEAHQKMGQIPSLGSDNLLTKLSAVSHLETSANRVEYGQSCSVPPACPF